MILDSLVQYYRALAASEEVNVPRFGYSAEKIAFALEIDEEGNLVGVLPQKRTDSGGKTVNFIKYQVPQHPKRSNGIKASFLADVTKYLLGISIDQKTGELSLFNDHFEASRKLHQDVLRNGQGKVARAILNFFEKWNPADWAGNRSLQDSPEIFTADGFSSFMVDGKWSFRDEEVRSLWSSYCANASGAHEGICLVTGGRTSISRLHPGIKGISGGQPSGTSLVSFNCDSFSSYGKDQGGNAPVGEEAAFEYGEALQHLFDDTDHVVYIGGMSLVGWASNSSPVYQDLMTGSFSGIGSKDESGDDLDTDSPEDVSVSRISSQDVNAAMEDLARGKSIEWDGVDLDPRERFSVLGVSPNGARLSVRFYWENKFGRFAENVLRHQERLSIKRPSFAKDGELSVVGMVRQTVRDGDISKANRRLGGELALAILNDSPYPATLLNGIDMRIRACGSITWQQASIIKAFYLKNGPETLKEVMTVELNEESNYTPYLLGRLFAVLGFVQKDASGVTTLRDRYFNSASATPSLVFPLIINLAEKHLSKMSSDKKGLAIDYERRITDLVGRIRSDFPKRLSLQERGAFQIGFYHETQQQYSKRNGDEEE